MAMPAGGQRAGAEDDLLDSLLDSATNLTAVGDTTFSSPPPTPAAGVFAPPSDPFSAIENQSSLPHSITSGQQTQETKQSKKPIQKPRYHGATTSTQSKGVSSRHRDNRLPSSKTSSVFDRLYKTQTAASKSWAPVRAQVRKGGGMDGTTSGVSSASVDDCHQIFSRLHITGTVANSKKRIGQRHTSSSRFSTTPVKKGLGVNTKFPRSGVSSPFSPRTPVRTSVGNLVYSPRMKPKTKLLFTSKHHAGVGVQDVQPISLGYSFFQAFCAYEAGESEPKAIAREVVQAFFRKDFPQER